MLRLSPDNFYHVYNHGNGDDNIFREEKNYPFFLAKYHLHLDTVLDTLSWCLMPNHFHLLVKIKTEDEIRETYGNHHPGYPNLDNLDMEKYISQSFSNFFNSYTKAYNKVYHRRGSLFLKNFKRKQADSQSYLRILVHYIHTNPVKHKFTTKAEQWKWSSFNTFKDTQKQWMENLFNTETEFQASMEAYLKSSKRKQEDLDIEMFLE